MAKGLEFQPQHQSFQRNPGLISFRMDWLDLLAVQGTLNSSPTLQFKSINSSMLSFLHSPTLTSIHDHWKNHSLDLTRLEGRVSCFQTSNRARKESASRLWDSLSQLLNLFSQHSPQLRNESNRESPTHIMVKTITGV